MIDHKKALLLALGRLDRNDAESRERAYQTQRKHLDDEIQRTFTTDELGEAAIRRLDLYAAICSIEREYAKTDQLGVNWLGPGWEPGSRRQTVDVKATQTVAGKAAALIAESAQSPQKTKEVGRRRRSGEVRPPTQPMDATADFLARQLQRSWRIEVAPTVFAEPRTGVAHDYASVMMSFRDEMTPVFKAIQSAGKQAGFKVERADEVWRSQIAMDDVFSMIYKSSIVICDFTGGNPNVFYEAGIAHTLGRHVIPIVQSENDIPFNVSHHRFLRYKNTKAGLHSMRRELINRMSGLMPSNASID